MYDAPFQFELPNVGPRGMHAIERAAGAVDKVKEPQLAARIDILRGLVASQHEHWKEAYALEDSAIEAYTNANLPRAAVRAALEAIELRFERNAVSDEKEVRAIAAKWLPVARTLKGPDDDHLAIQLERDDALARYWLGDVAAGHAELLRLWKPTPDPEHGVVFAQLGDLRSAGAVVADHVKLVVLPTRRIAGKVTLGNFDYTQTQISINAPNSPTSLSLVQIAMIMPDGSFTADGVQQTKVAVGVQVSHGEGGHVRFTPVPASHEPITGLTRDATATSRTLDVLARSKFSAPLETVQILLFPGKQHFATAGQLNAAATSGAGIAVQFGSHVTGEHVPKALVAKYRAGDLTAHFTDVPTGDVTVCAIGLPGDLMDKEAMRKIQAHLDELEVSCEIVDGQADMVLVLTHPPKNFD